MATNSKDAGTVCRIGVMSRIDYGSDGYRHALLERAAEIFRQRDVNYIILAAGLISAKDFQNSNRSYVKNLRARLREIKKEISELRGRDTRVAHAKTQELQDEHFQLTEELADSSKGPNARDIAVQLSKAIPRYTNAKGDRVKIHIVTAPAYDGVLGEKVAMLLSQKRKDIYSYRPGHDELFVDQAGKRLEVLTPEKAIWMRGDYYSTPHERLLKDREKQRDGTPPDIQLVAGFGATIIKPQGEAPRPWVAAPVLHKLQESRVAENQVGVLTMEIHRDRKDPVVRMFSLKGQASRERHFVRTPSNGTDLQKQIVELIKEHGKLSTGKMADMTNVSRDEVEAAAEALKREAKDPLKTWSGLTYYDDSHRWDLDRGWLMHHLKYPTPASENGGKDRTFNFGCPHLGSTNTDVIWFVEEAPAMILKYDIKTIVCAGDVKEGHKHNLILRGEVYRGMNDSTQEEIAGKVFGKIVSKVFKSRFEKAMNVAVSKRLKPSSEVVAKLLDESLVNFVVIPGNHDLWSLDDGHTPLMVMKAMFVRYVEREIEAALAKYGYGIPFLYDLVRRKIVEPLHGRTTLPSGLRMSILHPHMARSKTTSMRPQQMLAKELGTPERPGSQVVVGANFHVAEVIGEYDGFMGQRVCIQCGTLKHRTGFEDNLLKIVDQGVVCAEIVSDGERISSLEAFHQGNDSRHFDRTENEKMYDKLMEEAGLA